MDSARFSKISKNPSILRLVAFVSFCEKQKMSPYDLFTEFFTLEVEFILRSSFDINLMLSTDFSFENLQVWSVDEGNVEISSNKKIINISFKKSSQKRMNIYDIRIVEMN